MDQNQTIKMPTIRPIEPGDITVVADIIRQVMTEFQAVGCDYSINDAEVDDMYSAYAPAGSAFYIVEHDGQVLGCGGYAPLTGDDKDICELRKMHFLPTLRGTGMGKKLLQQCLDSATRSGYLQCYLETMQGMHQACRLYHKHGFTGLDQPMGNTGHSSCESWMVKTLEQ